MADSAEVRLRSYVVFSQQPDAQMAIAEWDAHARRFFGASVRAGAAPGSVVVTSKPRAPGERSVTWRLREAEDLVLSRTAESRHGGGLGALAERCAVVWVVERVAEPDPGALLLSAILASVLLGPILDARGPELLGVKSARQRIERMTSD
jgi:hypothetical protein